MIVQDGGVVETASKTIPILLRTVNLDIYPEGGDLVAGLVNRVYIEGRTPNQKPADMAGIIVNGSPIFTRTVSATCWHCRNCSMTASHNDQ